MKGFPKVLKTKEDYYNCLAMVASGELAAADLLAKIESAENQRYIECGVAAVEEEKKAVTVYYCDEAAVGMKFVAGDVSGTVQGVTHEVVSIFKNMALCGLPVKKVWEKVREFLAKYTDELPDTDELDGDSTTGNVEERRTQER